MMLPFLKRLFPLLLAFLMSFVVTISSLAEKETAPKILVDANGQSVIYVGDFFWIDEDSIVFADGTDRDFTLYCWQTGGEEAHLRLPILNNMLDQCQKMHPDTSFTYLPISGGLCAFSKNAQFMYIYYDCKWNDITDSIQLYNIQSVYQALLDGNILYLHVKMKSSDGRAIKKVIRHDLSTSISSLIPIENIEGVSTYKDGILLVQVNDKIMTYDPASNHIGDVLYHTTAPSSGDYSPFVYDSFRDKLIYMIDGDLYQADAGGQVNCIRTLETTAFQTSTPNQFNYKKKTVQGLYLLQNGMVGLLKRGILTVFWPESVTPSVEMLHITKSVYPLADAFYQLKNPNIRIEYCLPVGSHIEISDLQEAGHPVDIFNASSATDLLDLIKEGKVQSLHSATLIDQLVASYLPSISEKITCGSLPMALPYMVYVHLWEVNDEKWSYYEMPPPPTTFDELQCQMVEWDIAGLEPGVLPVYLGDGGMGNAKASLAMLLTHQYIEKQMHVNGFVDFKSYEYRDLIEDLIDLPNMTTSETGTMLRGMIFRGLIFSPIDRLNEHIIPSAEYGSDNKYLYILPLRLYPNEGVQLMGRLSALCLSKYSINKTRAMDYLEFIAQYQIDFESDTIASFQGELDYGCSELNLLYSQIVSNIKIEQPSIDDLQYENLDSLFESFFNVDLSGLNLGTPISPDPFSADEIDGLLNLLSACFAN